MRSGRRPVPVVPLAEAPDAAHRRLALLERREAAVHRAAGAVTVVSTPRIIGLGVRRRRECGGRGRKTDAEPDQQNPHDDLPCDGAESRILRVMAVCLRVLHCERRLESVVLLAEAADAADACHALFVADEAATGIVIGRAVTRAPWIILRARRRSGRHQADRARNGQSLKNGNRSLHRALLISPLSPSSPHHHDDLREAALRGLRGEAVPALSGRYMSFLLQKPPEPRTVAMHCS